MLSLNCFSLGFDYLNFLLNFDLFFINSFINQWKFTQIVNKLVKIRAFSYQNNRKYP